VRGARYSVFCSLIVGKPATLTHLHMPESKIVASNDRPSLREARGPVNLRAMPFGETVFATRADSG
jgi:hypothetical protein